MFFEDRHSCESRLCRFFIFKNVVLLGFFVIIDEFLWDVDLTDEVEVDFYVLHSMTGGILRCLKHANHFYEFMQDRGVQFRDLTVFPDNLQEGVDPIGLLLLLVIVVVVLTLKRRKASVNQVFTTPLAN